MSFNRSGYIGRAPGDSSVTIARKSYEPTGVQTDFTFSAGYDPGYCDVYLNGIRLINGNDYTASNGSTVGLTSAAASGDIVEIVAYKAFNLGQPLSDITGDLTISDTLTATNVSGTTSVTAGTFYGSASGLTGVASTDYIITGTAATFNSQVKVLNLNVTGITSTTSFNVGSATTIDGGGINVTGVITATSFSGNVTGGISGGTVAGSTGTFSGAVNVDDTTDSTSATTGALIVDGGLGIAKNVYIGAGLSVAGTLTYEDVTNVDSVGLITAKSGVNVSGGQVTIGSGITMGIAGVATFSGTGDVHLHDNVRLNVGDASDLSIYHNGSHSYIEDSGTGRLIVKTSYFEVDNAAGNEAIIEGIEDAGVKLYYNGSQKFETTNDGTVTTGIGTFTGLDVADKITHTGDANTAIRFPGNDNITFETNGSERLRISAGTAGTCLLLTGDRVDSTSKTLRLTLNHYSFNTVNQIDIVGGTTVSGANRVHIGGNDQSSGNTCATEIKFYTGANATTTNGSQRLRINSGGDVEFYGTSAGVSSVFWDASADSLIFKDKSYAKFGDSSDLSIHHEAGNAYMDNGTGDLYMRNSSGQILIRANTNAYISNYAANEHRAAFNNNGSVDLYYDGTKKFETTTAGITVSGSVTDDKGDVRRIIYQNKTSGYTLVAADAGKAIHISTGGVTINNSIFSAGDAVTIVNNSGSSQTITQGSGVTLYNTGDDGSTGNKTLKARGICTVWFSSASVGYISGNFD